MKASTIVTEVLSVVNRHQGTTEGEIIISLECPAHLKPTLKELRAALTLLKTTGEIETLYAGNEHTEIYYPGKYYGKQA